jgi:hypothetical protein
METRTKYPSHPDEIAALIMARSADTAIPAAERRLKGVQATYLPGAHGWRTPLPGDTPLEYVNRMQRVDWRIRDRVPGYSHKLSRERILTLRPLRGMLRDERRRAIAFADRYVAEMRIPNE